jgi:hypothetical protein
MSWLKDQGPDRIASWILKEVCCRFQAMKTISTFLHLPKIVQKEDFVSYVLTLGFNFSQFIFQVRTIFHTRETHKDMRFLIR